MNELMTALRLQEMGIAQVSAKNAEWMDGAMKAIQAEIEHARSRLVNADILRCVVVWACGEPSSPNAWGALFNHLEKSGKIVYTGVYTRSTRKAARGRQIPVWRWA